MNFVLFTNKQYSYNSWYGEHTENDEIYEQAVKPIVISSLDGINGTVFMYGQTGSGKTYTMLGEYSKEIRESAWVNRRSGSNKMRIRSGSRNHNINQSSSLKRNWSFSALQGKMGTPFNSKLMTSGLQKQLSVGITNGLPPKSAGSNQPTTGSDGLSNKQNVRKTISSDSDNLLKSDNSNAMSFASYIRNWKQYNVTPKKGIDPLTRNKSDGKLQGASTVNIDDESNKGVLIYSLNELFNQIENYSVINKSLDEDFKDQGNNMKSNTFIIRWSYFEIYNDTIYDLLSDINEFDKPLMVWEDPKKKDFYVKGLVEVVVDTLDECLDILKMGEFNRHYAATSMNHQSSRSHTIFRLWIQNMEHLYKESSSFDGNYTVWKESILNFIDLAGSEKVSNHHNKRVESKGLMMSDQMINTNIQERVNEGKHINKSLFFLTQVISLKAQGKSEHIPFRNSPLTKILRSSLGGNSRTAIILWATPTISQYEQTLSTMRFGFSAKKIENKICANITKNCDEEGLKAVISDYESRLKDFEGDREIISELQQQQEMLRLRLQRANETWSWRVSINLLCSWSILYFYNIGNTAFNRPQQRKLVDDAVVHWK